MTGRQIQKAGGNSAQYQAQTIIQMSGITEERVHDIVNEECSKVAQTCILESGLIVERRLGDFKSELYGSIAGRGQLLSSLQEPSCVNTLVKAAKAATRTDEARDQKLLAELLVKRFETPNDRHVATGVSQAIDIVEFLTDEELTGLTVYFAVNQYAPTSPSISDGFKVMDDLFGSLALGALPTGEDWIENLDIHNALRIIPFSGLRPLADFYFDSLSGYTTCGVKVGSDQEREALRILEDAGIPYDIFVEHELNPGYKRLSLRRIDEFDQVSIICLIDGTPHVSSLSDKQSEALRNVADICKNENYHASIRENLDKKLHEYPSITKVGDWWESIPSAPRITAVGRCLASANARRINPSLPDIN